MTLSLFWGDLHRHSSEGDGRDPLVKHFATARDFLRLDFMAMTNCGILTRDPMDRSLMRAARRQEVHHGWRVDAPPEQPPRLAPGAG